MTFGYRYILLLSNDTQLKEGGYVENLTPKQQGAMTYKVIQERKKKAARSKQIADIQARQILVERSLNAKASFHRQRKK